jgi:hypothetical protein
MLLVLRNSMLALLEAFKYPSRSSKLELSQCFFPEDVHELLALRQIDQSGEPVTGVIRLAANCMRPRNGAQLTDV